MIALMAQTFHYVEHVAQVYQHWKLGLSIAESKGILFFLDLEWNHFIFNTLYLVLLIIVSFNLHKLKGYFGSRAALVVLDTCLFVQGYHSIEHAVRMVQYFSTGCTPCKGILGFYFDGVYLHFLFNTLVLILPLISFFMLGFHKKIRILFDYRYENSRK